MEFVSFFVTKNSGKKELYDRSKVERSIMRACNKRNIAPGVIDRAINELEVNWAMNKKGITSKRLGKDILRKLRDVDEVAMLRFASVYNNFENHDDFSSFISEEFD